MRYGMTGTREGVTDKQKAAFELWLAFHPSVELAHGAAIGADEYVALRVASHGNGSFCVAFPSNIPNQTSQRAIKVSHEVHPERPPLERNQDIVEYSNEMLAFPGGMAEKRRSGTWATIRRARRWGRSIQFFWPDGTVTKEPSHAAN